MKNKDKKTFSLKKLLFVIVGVLILFGSFKSCTKVSASTDYVQLGSFHFDQDISLPVLNNITTHFQDLEIVCDSGVWFKCNGNEFTKMKFLYTPNIGTSGGFFSLTFINNLTNESLIVYNWSSAPSGSGGNWVDDSYRFFDVVNMVSLRTFFYGSVSNDLPYFCEIITITPSYFFDGYNEGFDVGYQKAVQDMSSQPSYYDGYRIGKQEGLNDTSNPLLQQSYDSGYSEGYNVGYDDAMDDSNVYSFRSLIAAVIDVPVKTITGLFNFNFLGINLSTFVFSLMTLALVIIILKKII